MLPPLYTSYTIKSFFKETKKLNFLNLALTINSYKFYEYACEKSTDINCLTLALF